MSPCKLYARLPFFFLPTVLCGVAESSNAIVHCDLKLKISFGKMSEIRPVCQQYTGHYNPLLIRNRSGILTINKDIIFWKNLLEKTFLASKKWVKNIQTAGYNGACSVYCHVGNMGKFGLKTEYLKFLKMSLLVCFRTNDIIYLL